MLYKQLFLFISRNQQTLQMDQEIKIVEQYPDFGNCIHHGKQIIRVCCSPSCLENRQGLYCKQCESFHKNHKSKTNKQFLKQISQKLCLWQPVQKASKEKLKNTFSQISSLSANFQQKISQISIILQNINTSKAIIFENALKCSQTEMFDKICEIGFARNSKQIVDLSERIHQFKFNHSAAPQAYAKILSKIQQIFKRFLSTVQKLMDEALQISNLFSFEAAINQINKKQTPVPPVVVPPAVVSAPVDRTVLNLANKDLLNNQIIQEITKADYLNLVVLNLQGNRLDDSGLVEILFSDKIRFPKLKELSLKNCYLEQDTTITLLIQTESLPVLEKLDISCNTMLLLFKDGSEFEVLKTKWNNNFVLIK